MMVNLLKLRTRRALVIIIGFTVILFMAGCRTPYSLVKHHANIALNCHYKIEEFSDFWGATGDGETIIVISFYKQDIKKIVGQCIENNFRKLPVIELLPDDFIYKYLSKDDTGYYKLTINEKDHRNYMITVLNTSTNKLILYYVLY